MRDSLLGQTVVTYQLMFVNEVIGKQNIQDNVPLDTADEKRNNEDIMQRPLHKLTAYLSRIPSVQIEFVTSFYLINKKYRRMYFCPRNEK